VPTSANAADSARSPMNARLPSHDLTIAREERRLPGYGALATEVYDLAYPVGHSMRGDVEHYRGVLAGVSGRVLEPAVGNGRVLIPLLQAGLDVDGYDLSSAMIELCRRRCRERGLDTSLRVADMSIDVVPDTYAAVIVPTGSIALLDGREETAAALRCFHDSLTAGGLLVLDVPAPSLIGTEPLRTWQQGTSTWTLQTMGGDFDTAANQTTRWLRYDRWIDNKLDASELLQFRLQHWSAHEFSTLLADAGFVDVAVTGDYAGPPDRGSQVWTFHGRRG
jgi:SAM-dependent methyltransferase